MKKHILVALAGILMIVVFLGALYVTKPAQRNEPLDVQPTPAASPLIRDHSPRAGNAEARVSIVEFFDPACGTCRAFHPFVKELMREHPGKVNLAVRYAPLHQGSDHVVAILEAARLQGRFWETLERAYATQDAWVINHRAYPDRFLAQLDGLGLDRDRLLADAQGDEVRENVRADVADARALGVDKTPGFFVSGKPLTRFGYDELRQLVEREVQMAY